MCPQLASVRDELRPALDEAKRSLVNPQRKERFRLLRLQRDAGLDDLFRFRFCEKLVESVGNLTARTVSATSIHR